MPTVPGNGWTKRSHRQQKIARVVKFELASPMKSGNGKSHPVVVRWSSMHERATANEAESTVNRKKGG
jgi:hypothetical protein